MTSPGAKRVLLASTNPAKQEKLRWLLDGLGFDYTTPADLAPTTPVPEEGNSHRENAEHKARVWSERAGMMAVASDGGLVIPALGEGWKALHTGRFAGAGASDVERLDRLLELMRPYTGDQRAACWTEALALAEGGRLPQSWCVRSQPGLLATEYDPTGIKPGFWAFSLWYLPHLGKSYSRLSEQEMEGLEDHWGRLRGLARGFFASRAAGS